MVATSYLLPIQACIPYVPRSHGWSLTGCTQKSAQRRPETRALTPSNGSLGCAGGATYSALYSCKLACCSPGTDSPTLQPLITFSPSFTLHCNEAKWRCCQGYLGKGREAGWGGTEVVCYLPTWLMWDEIWLCPGGIGRDGLMDV